MKLVFPPSAKRIIPYPPVGIAILAAALQGAGQAVDGVYDLEMALADEQHRAAVPSLLYAKSLKPAEVLEVELTPEIAEYGRLLLRLIEWTPGADLGISVMGFEQLASALLLGRLALAGGGRVLFGGQFFTAGSADQTVSMLGPWGTVGVTVGDGWEAVRAFADHGTDPASVPNTTVAHRGERHTGPRLTSKSAPPQPDYGWVDWAAYERFGSRVYRNPTPVRRAHLYVWDKVCNFRCAFCRVASGSKAILTSPVNALDSLDGLLAGGIRQANFMTNELNPSHKYLLRFLDEMESRNAIGATWFSYIRADRVDAADFARIRRVGGRLARYGVESGSQRLLDLMRKDYDVATMGTTLRNGAGADVWNHVNLLVGFPGEEERDVDETIRFLEANAASIHSVRINPFYLPPDTPIARAPAEFGIRLTKFDRGWWEFEGADGRKPESAITTERIEKISAACVELGIGFAGTDPFFLTDVIDRHDTVDGALDFLKAEYPAFWVPAPTDFYKALIGGYSVSSEWRDTVNRRQQNYSLSICTD